MSIRHLLRRSTMLAIAVVGVAVLGVGACSDGSSPPAPQADPPSSPEPVVEPTPAEPRAGDLLWRTPASSENFATVARIGDGYVVTTAVDSTRYDLDGQRQWVVREPDRLREATQSFAAGAVVVRYSVVERRDEGVGHVRVLDVRTGDLRWQADVGEVATSRSLLYTTRCADEGGEVSRGCAVVASDLATGRERWRSAVSDGLSSLELVGRTLHVTSYPYGTDRTEDPYGERTLAQTLDARSGKSLGPAQLGNGFLEAERVLVEESYARSAGADCTLDLVARRLDGTQLWTRSFSWTLSKPDRDSDCAIAVSAGAIAGGRFDLSARGGFGQTLDAATGRTRWAYGPRRLLLDSSDGVDVVTDYSFAVVSGVDSRTHEPVWRQRGNLSFEDDPDGFIVFNDDTYTGDEGLDVRSIATGEVSLRSAGTIIGSGEDWAALVVPTRRGPRVQLVAWPH